MGISKSMTPVPLFDLKFLKSNAPLAPQELQISGTSRKLVTPMSNPELLVVFDSNIRNGAC